MDRCHRIGQVKPVLVFRLATAHSVEGKMLRRAADKMALERLVIKKGAFKEIHSEVRGGTGGCRRCWGREPWMSNASATLLTDSANLILLAGGHCRHVNECL